jgi:hypothetical protein
LICGIFFLLLILRGNFMYSEHSPNVGVVGLNERTLRDDAQIRDDNLLQDDHAGIWYNFEGEEEVIRAEKAKIRQQSEREEGIGLGNVDVSELDERSPFERAICEAAQVHSDNLYHGL